MSESISLPSGESLNPESSMKIEIDTYETTITTNSLEAHEELNGGTLWVNEGDPSTHYHVERQIGLGAFGVVYAAVRISDQKAVAIKFEPSDSETPQLRDEYRTYKNLVGWDRIPAVIYFGTYAGDMHGAVTRKGNGCEQSRRDDIEALWYLILYLLDGKLPWQGVKATNLLQKHRRIGEIKQEIAIKDLCGSRPGLDEGLRHIRSLGFMDVPNYDLLRNLLLKTRVESTQDDTYDWDKLPAAMRLAYRVAAFRPRTPTRETTGPTPGNKYIIYNGTAQIFFEDVRKGLNDYVWRLQRSRQPQERAARLRARFDGEAPVVDQLEEALKVIARLSGEASWEFLTQGSSPRMARWTARFGEVRELVESELKTLRSTMPSMIPSPRPREEDRPVTPEDQPQASKRALTFLHSDAVSRPTKRPSHGSLRDHGI
ncbi:kinase-like domain-containing protein [Verticillium dahliae]|nr:kinase-like domain-containing protein [Verticillium dahliae]